jgi:hypothetical protein
VHQGVHAHRGYGLQVARVVPRGQHDDPRVGGGLAQPRKDLLGRLEVHVQLRDHDVGLRLGDPDVGLGAGGGAAHHLYALAGGEDGLQPLPEHGVVVGEVHPHGHFGSLHGQGPCRSARKELVRGRWALHPLSHRGIPVVGGGAGNGGLPRIALPRTPVNRGSRGRPERGNPGLPLLPLHRKTLQRRQGRARLYTSASLRPAPFAVLSAARRGE